MAMGIRDGAGAGSRIKRLGAVISAVAVIAVLPACSKGGGTAATPKTAATTTTVAPTTTVAKPLSSDDLATHLIGVNDIGSAWQQEGEQYIGQDNAKSAQNNSSVTEVLYCNGKKTSFGAAANPDFHGEAAVSFTQDQDPPYLTEDLISGKPDDITKALAAFQKVYGNCDKAKVTDTYKDGTSDSVTATVTQFAIPNTGADEQYAYVNAYSIQGQKVNVADVFMRKGSIGVQLEYEAVNQFDAVEMSDLASAAIRKLDNPSTSS